MAVATATPTETPIHEPFYYPEGEEEELFISEPMQEIQDGTFVNHTMNSPDPESFFSYFFTNYSDFLSSSSRHSSTHREPVCGARPTSCLHCHHHRKTHPTHTVVQGRTCFTSHSIFYNNSSTEFLSTNTNIKHFDWRMRRSSQPMRM